MGIEDFWKRAKMQTNYSNIEQGEIVLANVGYSDLSGSKPRPVLVISSTFYNQNSGNLIVLSISSKPVGSKYDSLLANENLIEGELKLASKILVDFPTTLAKNLCKTKIGKITQQKLLEVKEKMKKLYSL